MPNPQLIIATTAQIWKESIARIRPMPESLKNGDIKIVKGAPTDFLGFMTLFRE